MAEPEISRKLAVIVHADVVGSTALVQRDETLAHQRINAAFQQFSRIIQDYGGTVHEIRGDALVAEFARPSDAVCAALKFQQSNNEQNAVFDDEIVPVVRIGIALGEEVFAHDTVTGAGVVLAQRVEQLATPGGVCVTAAIHEAIPNRMPLFQNSLGEQELKGFEEPVRVYQVNLKQGEAVPGPEALIQPQMRTRRLVATSAAIALVVAAGLVLWIEPWSPGGVPASVSDLAFPLSDKPSIAVLPFANISNDPNQEYFVDGMTKDLITDLSKISGLFVIARHSSFAYKDRSPDVRQVARELGVRYVLEGSARRSGDSLRINVQLTDANKGASVWAERYDELLSDVFGLQDKLTRRIVAALRVELTPQEQTIAAGRGTKDIEAYDMYLQGAAHLRKRTSEDAVKAVQLFQKAIDLDPNYGAGHAVLAQTYWDYSDDETFNSIVDPGLGASFLPSGFATFLNAWKHLQNARVVPSSQVHALTARMLQRQRRFDEALEEAKKAVVIGPNDSGAYNALIENLIYAGQPEQALTLIDETMHLEPNLPGEKLFLKGMSLYTLERLDEAAATIEKARSHNPSQTRYAAIHAAALAELGRPRHAEVALKSYLSKWPDQANLNWAMFQWPFQQKETVKRLANAFIKAGMRLPQRRYYLATASGRLTSGEMMALLSSKTMKGANRGYFGLVDRTFFGIADNEFVVSRDETGRIIAQGDLNYFRTNGTTQIKSNLLCDHWLDFLGEYCVAVYRNPLGTRETKDEYLFFTLMSTFSFSVFDSPG